METSKVSSFLSFFSEMRSLKDKEKAINKILKIIKDFKYYDELSDKYKRETLDQDKIYD